MQIDNSRPHTIHSPDYLPRQVDHVCQDVFCHVVTHAPSVSIVGPPQKKSLSPARWLNKIKHVNSISCVDPCLFVPNVQNVPTVVNDCPVGGRLQKFWQVWQRLGANPWAVSILKEGYSLPFKMRPPLTRFPIIQSGYANPARNLSLKEALTSLTGKLVVELVLVRSSLALYNRLFLVPKTGKQWEAYSRSESVKPVPQNRHLQNGNAGNDPDLTTKRGVVTSLDFSDAYFHIPIHPRLRKYMRFFLNK